jgi:hypothetical protein
MGKFRDVLDGEAVIIERDESGGSPGSGDPDIRTAGIAMPLPAAPSARHPDTLFPWECFFGPENPHV